MGAAMLGGWRMGAAPWTLESEVRAVVIRDRDGRIPGTGYRDFLVGCVHRGEQEHRRSSTTPREATGPTVESAGRSWGGGVPARPAAGERGAGHDNLI